MKDAVVTLVQMNHVVGDPEGNLRRMEGAVKEHRDSDIMCFPEMCLSGYTTEDPVRFALSPDHPCVRRIRSLAKDYSIAIVFGYLEENGRRPFMRQEIADGTDVPKYYRKTHLGHAESMVFEAGDSLPVFDVEGICIGIQLCVESHIPDLCQTFRSQGAELVLTPYSNGVTGKRRKASWHSYMPARASDNGMYVIGCSATGDNGLGAVFGGGLIAIDPKGNIMDEYYGTDPRSMTVRIGGKLPRDGPETMSNISYFDRRRPELYR